VVLDKRHGAMRPTILIGNLTARDAVARIGASITDRMHQGGGFIEMSGPSKRREAKNV
jgi:hypothetical protein